MHESSLITALMKKIDAIAREHNGQRIVSVRVKLGALSHISASHFREHFDHAAKGTRAEPARLIVEELTDVHDPLAQEIILDSVELEDEA